jgi:DNA modification methylase
LKIQFPCDAIVNPKSLIAHPKNRNIHTDEQIKRLIEILEYQGWRHPIKVSRRSGCVVSGHGRLLAAIQMGWEVPVSYQDYESDEQEYADLVADNAIASWAQLDLSGINGDLADLGPEFEIDLLGIKDFTIEFADKEGLSDEDEVPEHVEPQAKLGDLYQLGNHRLLCGDSTSIDAVERLMGGAKADMVFTDPPYGMNLETNYSSLKGSTKSMSTKADGNYKPIISDDKNFDPSCIFIPFLYCKEIFTWGADYYSERIPEKNNGSWVVWDKCTRKDGVVVGDSMVGSNFELCWSKSKHKRELARIMHKGLCSVENDKRQHPTQKPVKLAEWFFDNWGEGLINIVDLFGGSGSTLIACEKTSRQCFMMEIDPHYIDVIIARWEKFTGQKALLLNEEEISL